MNYTLAIDPGMKCTGWALFLNTTLVRCGITRSKHKTIEECAADHVRLLTMNHNPLSHPDGAGLHVVVERPKIYPRREQQKGDQNDLIAIACVGSLIAGRFGSEVSFLYPDQWKGQMPKDVSHRRIERRLDGPETAIMNTLPKIKLRHNGMDAIGIGLCKVGRRA